MSEDANKKVAVEKASIQIKRSAIQITPCGSPSIFSATEGITWNGGNIRLAAFGTTRNESVDALDKQVQDLIKALSVAEL
jgi:hypothetical protein